MTCVSDDLALAVHELSQTVGVLLSEPGILPTVVPKSHHRTVETVRSEPGGAKVHEALRGRDGVVARFASASPVWAEGPRTLENLAAGFLFASGSIQKGLLTDSSRLDPLSQNLSSALEKVEREILTDEVLRTHFNDYVRLGRTRALEKEEAFFDGLDELGRRFVVLPLFVERFRRAIVREGELTEASDHDVRGAYWANVADGVLMDLGDLRSRTENLYDLRAYLNSPSLTAQSLELGSYRVNDLHLEMVLSKATDDAVSEAFGESFPPTVLPVGLSYANLLLTIRFKLPVDATSEQAEHAADTAAEAARRVLDLLRILRSEDLGIGHACLQRVTWGAPQLPDSAVWESTESAAAFIPRRGVFGEPGRLPLSDSEMEVLRRWVPRHVGKSGPPGFAVAIRRFRDIYECHWPDDPEMLLDASIALEALLLNDQHTKELRYRLSVRAARLLSSKLAERKRIVRIVKDIYDLRSRVAHGETLESLKMADRTKLERALRAAPGILKAVFRTYLEENGPAPTLDRRELADWWSDLELSEM